MARKEAEMGITATYYFRTHDDVFKPDIIIADLGHKIGYREARGDNDKAIMLKKAGKTTADNAKTISMHGGLHILYVIRMREVFVPWACRDLWKKYNKYVQ